MVAMVTDLLCHLTYNSRGAWHTVYAMLLSNYKRDATEIQTMKKLYFVKYIIFLKSFKSVLFVNCEQSIELDVVQNQCYDNSSLCFDVIL